MPDLATDLPGAWLEVYELLHRLGKPEAWLEAHLQETFGVATLEDRDRLSLCNVHSVSQYLSTLEGA